MLGSMIIVWLVVPIVITHSFSFILLNSGEPLIISLPKDLTGFVYPKERCALVDSGKAGLRMRTFQLWGINRGTFSGQIQFLGNPGYSPGMRGDHLYDEVQRYDSLSDMLQDNSPVGELGELDFFQLRVHDK